MLALRRNGEGTGPLTLQGDELELTGLALDGMPLAEDRYEATPERLVVRDVPDGPFVLEMVTELNPAANTKLMGLYRSGRVYCTQCEAEGFRRITYFLDRPDVLSVYTTRIEAAKSEAPVLLVQRQSGRSAANVAGSDRHYAVWHDPFPKPSYLFAMVAGDLGAIEDEFVTMSGRKVALRIYASTARRRAAPTRWIR